MLNIHNIASSRGSYYLIPLDKISIEPTFNVREDLGDIPGLAKDIANNGLKLPLIVRVDGDKVVLVDGHRRLKALKYAKDKLNAPIPGANCILEGKGANEESRIVDMFGTGVNVKPLTTLEQAKAIKRLLDLGWTIKKISQQTGKSAMTLNGLLDLNGAPQEIRTAVAEKKMSATAAQKLARAPETKQKEILDRVKSSQKKVKVRDVEKATKGTPDVISAKQIRGYIARVNQLIETYDHTGPVYWEYVLEGLEIALGVRQLPAE